MNNTGLIVLYGVNSFATTLANSQYHLTSSGIAISFL